MFKLFPGAIVNRWTLIEPLPPTANYIVRWKCQCKCGKFGRPSAHNLKYGVTKGCGCRRGLRRKNEQVVGLRTLRTIYMVRARKKEIAFSLSPEQFNSYTSGDCFYCGAPPRIAKFGRVRIDNTRAKVCYNGIDRIINTTGYVLGNCVSCCMTCNIMKGILSVKDFLDHIERILRRSRHVQTV